jgi:hypothetical protein
MDRTACFSLPAIGKLISCFPSSNGVEPRQASRSMVTMPTLSHETRRMQVSTSRTGFCTWVGQMLGFEGLWFNRTLLPNEALHLWVRGVGRVSMCPSDEHLNLKCCPNVRPTWLVLPESRVNSELPELSYQSCELYSTLVERVATESTTVVTAFGY